uniref:Uncharacterized protein n=1 Tax=Steinernema glaseri TaxID=37863 RepID=A0A1I8AQ37_9BILA
MRSLLPGPGITFLADSSSRTALQQYWPNKHQKTPKAISSPHDLFCGNRGQGRTNRSTRRSSIEDLITCHHFGTSDSSMLCIGLLLIFVGFVGCAPLEKLEREQPGATRGWNDIIKKPILFIDIIISGLLVTYDGKSRE